MHHYPDTDEHMTHLWKLIGYAARYGHQPMASLMLLSSDEVVAFNRGVEFWIEAENQSARGENRGG